MDAAIRHFLMMELDMHTFSRQKENLKSPRQEDLKCYVYFKRLFWEILGTTIYNLCIKFFKYWEGIEC